MQAHQWYVPGRAARRPRHEPKLRSRSRHLCSVDATRSSQSRQRTARLGKRSRASTESGQLCAGSRRNLIISITAQSGKLGERRRGLECIGPLGVRCLKRKQSSLILCLQGCVAMSAASRCAPLGLRRAPCERAGSHTPGGQGAQTSPTKRTESDLSQHGEPRPFL